MAVMQTPSPQGSLQKFLDTEDFTLLEKPIIFEKTDKYKNLQCCSAATLCICSFGLTSVLVPIATFCPFVTYKHFGLKLDKDSVQISTAANDCCCHVATTQKTVPLEKIQDVELQESCIHTCFGLKQVNVQTAGTGGLAPEVAAAFLASPEQARLAIQAAVKLHKQHMTAPGLLSGMQRGPAGPTPGATSSPSGGLMQRLQCMEQLIARGVLSREEFSSLKVAVLAAERDPTQQLMEASDLVDKGLLNQQEFGLLKQKWIAHIKDGF